MRSCLSDRYGTGLLPGLAAALVGCTEQTAGPAAPESPAAVSVEAQAITLVQLSAGGRHTCGLTADGRAFCWGSNTFGQLGDGSTRDRAIPTAVHEGLRFRQISAGMFHTCAVTASNSWAGENRAYCWGNNSRGQLGIGSTEDPIRNSPTLVLDRRRFRIVNAGYDHTCAVTPTGAGFCWGSNGRGQLGSGTGSSSIPVRVARGLEWRGISAGGQFSCGVTMDNQAYCWGENLFGQLGDGTRTRRLTPTPVAGGLSFREVAAGGGGFTDQQQTEIFETHACGVTTDHKAYCWGSGGALGDGTTETRLTPAAVLGSRRWRQVTAGFTHSCGVTRADVALCWGANSEGQLGDGTNTARLKPTRVFGGLAVSDITTGVQGLHTCGRSTDGGAWCWGYNGHGQLGDGTTTRRLAPVAVLDAP